MVRRDGAEVRKERIQQITKHVLSLLHKNDGEIPLSKTIALLQYEFGLRRATVMEYSKLVKLRAVWRYNESPGLYLSFEPCEDKRERKRLAEQERSRPRHSYYQQRRASRNEIGR